MCGLLRLSVEDRALLEQANQSVGVLAVAAKLNHGSELRGQRVEVVLGDEARAELGAKRVLIYWDDFRAWCKRQMIQAPVLPIHADDCSEAVALYAAS